MFSVLDEGGILQPHVGDWRGVLRLQMVLDVPAGDGDCLIMVHPGARTGSAALGSFFFFLVYLHNKKRKNGNDCTNIQ